MKNQVNYLIVLIFWISSCGVFAQNGEGLFKAKCNTCHSLKKNSIGPKLQGVQQKWNEAGEGELLYDWVKNSGNLISSGKSNMARAIEKFNMVNMPAQSVNNEEIDAIFHYIDNWSPPILDENPDDLNKLGELELVEKYKTNLTLFYALLITTVLLLVSIIVSSGSIKNYLRSESFRKDLQKVKGRINAKQMKNIVLIIISSVLVANSSRALEFLSPGEAIAGEPWLLVETFDLFGLLALNILLVGVLVYLKRILVRFIELTKDENKK